jgi:hypothetical protein
MPYSEPIDEVAGPDPVERISRMAAIGGWLLVCQAVVLAVSSVVSLVQLIRLGPTIADRARYFQFDASEASSVQATLAAIERGRFGLCVSLAATFLIVGLWVLRRPGLASAFAVFVLNWLVVAAVFFGGWLTLQTLDVTDPLAGLIALHSPWQTIADVTASTWLIAPLVSLLATVLTSGSVMAARRTAGSTDSAGGLV